MTPSFGHASYFVTIPVAIAIGLIMDRRYDTDRPYLRMENGGGTKRFTRALKNILGR